jgi:non-heme chloroperoxidase
MTAVRFNTRWITAVVVSACVASASSAATLEVEPGSSLYYSDEGKGTAILFIPGWTMTSEVFSKQQVAFSKTHRVIVLDPRGQGRSSKNGSQYTYIQQGHAIDKLVRHLGVDEFVLVGWSYGGLATYAYVRNHGLGKISNYVCIDPSPYPLDIKGGPEWNEGPPSTESCNYLEGMARREGFAASDGTSTRFPAEPI